MHQKLKHQPHHDQYKHKKLMPLEQELLLQNRPLSPTPGAAIRILVPFVPNCVDGSLAFLPLPEFVRQRLGPLRCT